MHRIIEMEAGSAVFGTKLPTSDTDLKFIFCPDGKDLIMQRPSKNIQNNTKNSTTEKNDQNDIDCEGFSVQQYLKLLTDGQTIALDMLFTPERHYCFVDREYGKIWNVIRENKQQFLCKKVQSFVGYCRSQAGKYSVKGERLLAVNIVVEFLENAVKEKGTRIPFFEVMEALNKRCIESGISEHASFKTVENLRTNHNETYFECCNKMSQSGTPLIDVLARYRAIKNRYGARASMAASLGGTDAKALYHALRIGREAEELLLTGHITFPRPERDLLLDIRKGNLSYEKISELIDEALEKVENALLISTLPDEPNYVFVEDFIFDVHMSSIYRESGTFL